jgi:hypothetical protein
MHLHLIFSVCVAQRLLIGNGYLVDYFIDSSDNHMTMQGSKNRSKDLEAFKRYPKLEMFTTNYFECTGRILVYMGDDVDIDPAPARLLSKSNEQLVDEKHFRDTPKPNFAFVEVIINSNVVSRLVAESYLNKTSRSQLEEFDFRVNRGSEDRPNHCPIDFNGVVSNCVDFCCENNIDVMHVITYQWFLNECNDLDEKIVQNLIWGLIEDSQKYESYMLLVDVDSAVLSSSGDAGKVQWSGVMHILLEIAKNKAYAGCNSGRQKIWFVFATANITYIDLFRQHIPGFPLTKAELMHDAKVKALKKPTLCKLCNKTYLDDEHKTEICTWHTGTCVHTKRPIQETCGRDNDHRRADSFFNSVRHMSFADREDLRWDCCNRDSYSDGCGRPKLHHESADSYDTILRDIVHRNVISPLHVWRATNTEYTNMPDVSTPNGQQRSSLRRIDRK